MSEIRIKGNRLHGAEYSMSREEAKRVFSSEKVKRATCLHDDFTPCRPGCTICETLIKPKKFQVIRTLSSDGFRVITWIGCILLTKRDVARVKKWAGVK